jgi:hypothetical protein
MALCGKPTWKVFVEWCNRLCFNEGVKKDNLDLSPSLDSTNYHKQWHHHGDSGK